MLCFVFMSAMHLFQTPVQGLNLPVAKDGTAPPASSIGAALAQYVVKIGLLGLMALAGSVIANKGVHLYFASNQWANAHHGDGEKSAPITDTQKSSK